VARINFEVKPDLYAIFRSNCQEDGSGVSEVLRGLMVQFNRSKLRDRYFSQVTTGVDADIQAEMTPSKLLMEENND